MFIWNIWPYFKWIPYIISIADVFSWLYFQKHSEEWDGSNITKNYLKNNHFIVSGKKKAYASRILLSKNTCGEQNLRQLHLINIWVVQAEVIVDIFESVWSKTPSQSASSLRLSKWSLRHLHDAKPLFR